MENVVRISMGHFQPELSDKIQAILNNEFKEAIVPAIKKLKGNMGFYAGIDKEKHSFINVSFWETKEDAIQLDTLKEMLDMRVIFEKLGVKFIPITNNALLWKL